MYRDHAKDLDTYSSLIQLKRREIAEALQELAEYSEKLREAANALGYSLDTK